MKFSESRRVYTCDEEKIYEGIDVLCSRSHDVALEKGWWANEETNPRSIGDQFANFHAEVSEAWEEYRKYGMDNAWFQYYNMSDDGTVNPKPEGLAVELADLLIRVADTCDRYGIDLAGAIIDKMRYNGTRSFRHGGKKA